MFATSRTALPTVYPLLHFKAAVGRHCVPAVDYMMRHLAEWAPGGGSFVRDEGGGMTDVVRESLSNLARFYECIAYHPQWLPPEAAEEAHDALFATGIYHQSVCSFFMHRKRKLFHLTEKAHFCQHIEINLLSSSYNPRSGWTYQAKKNNELTSFVFRPVKNKASKSGQQHYVANSWVSQDEDYMERTVQVARAWSRARGPIRIGEALVFRWRNRMQLSWAKKERQRAMR